MIQIGPRIIGLSGKARSGKTTIANALSKLYGWNHLSLADSLKRKVCAEFGATSKQVYGPEKESNSPFFHSDGVTPRTWREVLIWIGFAYRQIDPSFWIKQTSPFLSPVLFNIISDVRFVDEAKWIQSKGGIVVRLNRDIDLRGGDIADPSETSLDNYEHFDLVIPESWNVGADDIEPLSHFIGAFAYKRFYAKAS